MAINVQGVIHMAVDLLALLNDPQTYCIYQTYHLTKHCFENDRQHRLTLELNLVYFARELHG